MVGARAGQQMQDDSFFEGVFGRPLLGDLMILAGLVVAGRFGIDRVVHLRRDHHGAQLLQHRAQLLGGEPLGLAQDVLADLALVGHVGVVDLGLKLNVGELEGVVFGELDKQLEDSSFERSLAGPVREYFPDEEIVPILADPEPLHLAALLQLLLQPFHLIDLQQTSNPPILYNSASSAQCGQQLPHRLLAHHSLLPDRPPEVEVGEPLLHQLASHCRVQPAPQ
jgi:hypothetical protein